ncbi:MAG: winged helix-turn-helix transcriptional regulator [Candidatus Aenigmarchaeota archaeon]|nr:winged helix-turn-helix transcriptional regulator [Candidatus Aenigmarchaeota archaeon]
METNCYLKERKIQNDYVDAIDKIEINLTAKLVASNINRVLILHILKNSPGNQMQTEKIANALGISHRTALYHLDILKDYELVEVRKFRKKGESLLRSVWGLNSENMERVNKIFAKIKKKFKAEELKDIAVANGGQRKKQGRTIRRSL